MKQVSQHYQSGALSVIEVPAPALRDGGVIVETQASLVSAGTEKMLVDLAKASLVGKAMARPDLVRQVVDKARQEGIASTVAKVRARLDTPIPLGYSCAGRVLEVGRALATNPRAPRVGDLVACGGAGYANHAELNFVPLNLCARVPEGVTAEDAAFVTVGAIALQGVRQAAPVLGERVVVIGLGLIGQLTAQLLRAGGCKVLGHDLDPARMDLAQRLGADAIAGDRPLAEAVAAFTDGRGADAVIVTASAKSSAPVIAAAEVARVKGRVVVVGMVGMDLPRDVFYRKELALSLSMSYGPGRYDPEYEEGGRDYPFAHVRWTEQRNMAAFLEQVERGAVRPRELITHRIPIAEAASAYELMRAQPASAYLGIVLSYPDAPRRTPGLIAAARRVDAPAAADAIDRDRPGVGFVGAGNFATGVLLPALASLDRARLTGVVTATGMSARNVARRHGFRFAGTDRGALFEDPDTDLVVIATRHDLHAPLVVEALAAGKAVLCEKPLAIDRAQLARVVAAAQEHGGRLTVGFNRRFSPLLRRARAHMVGRSGPLVMSYRVNAGQLPAGSWILTPEGGGRVIGEVCHFVDALQFLTGAPPTRVHACAARGAADCLHVTLEFADGSTGAIVYTAVGDRAIAKERLEVFGPDRAVILDDYRDATFARGGKRKREGGRRQDKGFSDELAAVLDAVTKGAPMPITLAELVATTEATFAIEESLRTRAPVELG
ncbi:MAG: bi-domain-containing oxidoreductase [Nannocystaceae bacterium]|nr:bi-domain-containing oxidoreductase [Myxococcales bacterium]